MSVIQNTQRLESNLRKKINSILYHAMRESVAMSESLTTHISTGENRANLLIKVLFERKWRYNVSNLIYDLYDDYILEHK